MLDFVIKALATWRLASLLVNESGPLGMFDKLRHAVGVRYDERSVAYGTNNLAELLTCVWCTSMWTALLFVLLGKRGALSQQVLALSAAAILIDSKVNKT